MFATPDRQAVISEGRIMFRASPLESVADAERRARKRLPGVVYWFVHGGNQEGVTARENVKAFSEIRFRARIGNPPQETNTSVKVMGLNLSMPVILSPVTAHAVHSGGEVAIGRAAASADIAYGVSNFATEPVESVMAVNQRTIAQLYWVGNRDQIAHRVERAWKAGVRALIVTMDWTHGYTHDWATPPLLGQLDLKTFLRYSPLVVTKPRWVFDFVAAGGLPKLTLPNFAVPERQRWTLWEGTLEWIRTPLPTWDDLAWLRKQWKGSFMVKGVIHPDDAKRCVDLGADALSVSNHGGNNLDGTIASVHALPAIVQAVGGQIDVLVDGGIRRGSDVVKALALGAKAVLIGRPYVWAFGARGEAGVREILEVFRADIRQALLGLGVTSVADLTAEHVILPTKFGRCS